MSITEAKATNSEKKQMTLPKKGPRAACLTGIVDIGIQQREWKGKLKAPRREFISIYTFHKDTYETEEGEIKNCGIRTFPMALYPGASKSNYYDWFNTLDPDHTILDKDGAGDITKLIGKNCFVVVEYSEPDSEGIVYANSKGISIIPEDYPLENLDFEPLIFDCTKPDKEVFDSLSNWIQDQIRKSVDYAGSDLEKYLETGEENSSSGESDDDDSPI